MIVLKDPALARQMGLISAKVQIPAWTPDWPAYLGFLAQATTVDGQILFSLARCCSTTGLRSLACLTNSRGEGAPHAACPSPMSGSGSWSCPTRRAASAWRPRHRDGLAARWGRAARRAQQLLLLSPRSPPLPVGEQRPHVHGVAMPSRDARPVNSASSRWDTRRRMVCKSAGIVTARGRCCGAVGAILRQSTRPGPGWTSKAAGR